MSKVEPLDNRVLLRPLEAADKTKGGIILPTQAKDKPTEGIVVSVGPGKLKEDGERIPIYVNEGDQVVYSKYAGTEITIDDIPHVVLRESDLIMRTGVAADAAAKPEPVTANA